MIDGVTFTNITEQQTLYIWDNLRDYDKVELQAAKFTRENIYEFLQANDETVCGLMNDVPVAIFGYVTTTATIRFNFFATNECKDYWKTITKSARSYMRWNIQKYPALRPIIEVWEKHLESRMWLKYLGFRETRAYRRTPYGKLIFVEYDKYSKRRL